MYVIHRTPVWPLSISLWLLFVGKENILKKRERQKSKKNLVHPHTGNQMNLNSTFLEFDK